MTLEEAKAMVVSIATDIGSYLPYESDQVDGETWGELAETLRGYASALATSANRMASYAGHATKQAYRE